MVIKKVGHLLKGGSIQSGNKGFRNGSQKRRKRTCFGLLRDAERHIATCGSAALKGELPIFTVFPAKSSILKTFSKKAERFPVLREWPRQEPASSTKKASGKMCKNTILPGTLHQP